MRKKGVIMSVLMGMLLMGSSCGGDGTERKNTPNVRLFTVKSAGVVSVQDFPGRVVAAEEVNLAFKVSGTLMRVYVEEGSEISKGQLVAEMDSRDYQTQLDAVEAEYKNVRSEAERVIALYADSVSTAEAYDKARYGLQQITAKYENARNQLADTKIYAPFDGQVQKLLFDPPAVMAAGMPVMTVVAEGRQEIEINIPASTYMERDGMASFQTSFDFMSGQTVQLRLIGMAPKANANQLYTVRLAVPQGLSPQPSPGMNAMVNILFNDTEEGKTQIPASALFRKDGQSCVWVYDEGQGIVNRRVVSVERLDTEGNAILKKGVSAGERIVVVGVHKLTDRQPVKPMASETETNIGGLL